MTKPKLLLISRTGFLGSHLAKSRQLQEVFEVKTTSRIEDLRFDLSDQSTLGAVQEFLLRDRPSYVLVTAAISDVEACALDPEGTRAVNVDGTIALLDEVRKSGAVPVFFSSDYALEPTSRCLLLNEEAPPRPLTEYGRQKSAVEEFIRRGFEQFLIFRISKLMSMYAHPKSILHQFIGPLKEGHEIKAFSNQWITPVFVEDIADIVSHPRLGEISGTFHLSTRKISRLELAHLIKERFFRHSTSRIDAVDMAKLGRLEKRPYYNTLDSSKIVKSLNFRFREIEEMLPSIVDS